MDPRELYILDGQMHHEAREMMSRVWLRRDRIVAALARLHFHRGDVPDAPWFDDGVSCPAMRKLAKAGDLIAAVDYEGDLKAVIMLRQHFSTTGGWCELVGWRPSGTGLYMPDTPSSLYRVLLEKRMPAGEQVYVLKVTAALLRSAAGRAEYVEASYADINAAELARKGARHA